MSLIEKYLSHTDKLLWEYREVREDNMFVFSQSGTNLSSVYWKKKISGFPYPKGTPIYKTREVAGVEVNQPIYPKAIIRIQMNSEAMNFIINAPGNEIQWDEFAKKDGWYIEPRY